MMISMGFAPCRVIATPASSGVKQSTNKRGVSPPFVGACFTAKDKRLPVPAGGLLRRYASRNDDIWLPATNSAFSAKWKIFQFG
jgi:hypothetical protein